MDSTNYDHYYLSSHFKALWRQNIHILVVNVEIRVFFYMDWDLKCIVEPL